MEISGQLSLSWIAKIRQVIRRVQGAIMVAK
jgi:hypothetical protein